ncbi:MAG: lipase [Actinobacteria bacterium]|nr:lipase [Actinomycetota bacterium]
MQRIGLPDTRVVVAGAVDIDQNGDGIIPRRLSNQWRYQYPLDVEVLASSPSGVRLAFTTDSKSIGVELLATHFQLGTGEGFRAAIDLVVNRELVESLPFSEGNAIVVDAKTGSFDFVAGQPTTVDFADVPDAEFVELWLPSNSTCELRAIHIDADATISAPPPDHRRRWVHHGSSISHCLEAHSGSRTWPSTAAQIGNVQLTNVGLAGQCHLDQFTARTIRDHPADLLSLKAGINIVNGDTLRLRTLAPALHGFLDTIREGHPNTPFLVISPILCPAHEEHAGPSDGSSGTTVALGTPVTEAQGALTLIQIREIVSNVVAARRTAGDPNLHYLDGRMLFHEADLADLPDGLHPNGDGYIRMGERFAAYAFAADGPFAT